MTQAPICPGAGVKNLCTHLQAPRAASLVQQALVSAGCTSLARIPESLRYGRTTDGWHRPGLATFLTQASEPLQGPSIGVSQPHLVILLLGEVLHSLFQARLDRQQPLIVVQSLEEAGGGRRRGPVGMALHRQVSGALTGIRLRQLNTVDIGFEQEADAVLGIRSRLEEAAARGVNARALYQGGWWGDARCEPGEVPRQRSSWGMFAGLVARGGHANPAQKSDTDLIMGLHATLPTNHTMRPQIPPIGLPVPMDRMQNHLA